MSRSLSTLLALLPAGRAWTRAPGTRLHDLLTAIGAEFDRVEARGADLLRESVPSDAVELLPEWEELTGADECVEAASIEARQAAVVARLRAGAPTLDLVLSTIEGMGYSAPTLTSWAPFRAGESAAGDALSNDEWQHSIGLTMASLTPNDDAVLRCTVERLQHAHVLVVWEFT